MPWPSLHRLRHEVRLKPIYRLCCRFDLDGWVAEPFELIAFADPFMPGGMNGVQLTVEARRIRPKLKVLLTSGYTAAALSLEHGLPDNLNVVEKPYRREGTGQETQAGDRRIDLLPRAHEDVSTPCRRHAAGLNTKTREEGIRTVGPF